MPIYQGWRFSRRLAYNRRRRWLWRRRLGPAYRGFRRRYRRRQQVRRKRKRGPKLQRVTQWAPARRMKCIISGFWPALAGLPSNVALQFSMRNLSNFAGGGIQTWQMTLHDFYRYHKSHLNTWSATNDGTDLARYFGTVLYCYPNDSFSYIVSWDRDLYSKDIKTYPIWLQHPYLQLLHPDHRVIWSLRHKGRAKAKRIMIRPPAQLTNEWYFQADIAKLNLFTVRFTMFDPDNVWLTPQDASIKMTVGHSGVGITGAKTGELFKVMYSVLWDTDTKGNLVAINRNAQPPASQTSEFANPDEYHNDMQWEYYGPDYPYWMVLWGTDFSHIAESEHEISTGNSVWIKWYPPTQKIPNATIDAQKPQFNKPKEWCILTRTQAQIIQKSGWFVPKTDNYDHNLFIKYSSRWQWGGYTPDATDTTIDPIPEPHTGGLQYTTRTSAKLQQVQVHDPSEVGQAIIHPWDLRRGMLTKRALQRITGGVDRPSLTATHRSTGEETGQRLSEEEASSEEADSSSEDETTPERRRTKRRKLQLHKLVRELSLRLGLLG
ncbi:putative ORF1 [Torque teno desmodus rotundus virus]|nr:putative ORF1 [Torque teno desmodus rotundus virus]